ncbi:LOW QUALITY PROTEIN: DUF3444 domain-containing protein, partial [Cephalotus follicularis]
PDQEFYNFEKNKKAEIFKTRQIWAVHYQAAMPQNYRYAQINNNDNYALSVTWLKPVGASLTERRWCLAGLPVSCGLFDLNPEKNEVIQLVFSFKCSSYLVVKEDRIVIYPQEGEIWALYKDWNIEEWAYNPEKLKGCKFELESCQFLVVEVISECSNENGIKICKLVEVKHFRTFFHGQKRDGSDMVRVVSPAGMLSFSHRIPAYKVPGPGIYDIPEGAWHLEPNALPLT